MQSAIHKNLMACSIFFGVFIPVNEIFAQTNDRLPLVCATRPEVLIRDFETRNTVGQLNQGECMEVVRDIQHSDPIIRAQYLTVRGGKSGKLRLVSKRFVAYSNSLPSANQFPQASKSNSLGFIVSDDQYYAILAEACQGQRQGESIRSIRAGIWVSLANGSNVSYTRDDLERDTARILSTSINSCH